MHKLRFQSYTFWNQKTFKFSEMAEIWIKNCFFSGKYEQSTGQILTKVLALENVGSSGGPGSHMTQSAGSPCTLSLNMKGAVGCR